MPLRATVPAINPWQLMTCTGCTKHSEESGMWLAYKGGSSEAATLDRTVYLCAYIPKVNVCGNVLERVVHARSLVVRW